MDGSVHTSTPSSSRKRPRENETESQKIKREKAAERQRRKRERDRAAAQAQAEVVGAALAGMMGYTTSEQQQQQHQQVQQQLQQQQQQQQMQQQQHQPPPSASLSASSANMSEYPQMTKEEIERRDKVRAAARERQRKHRLHVKQKKMRDLGMDMGNEMIPSMEDVHYRPPDGFHPVLPHEMQQPPPHLQLLQEPPFPQGQGLGGQTFASTLLLSFSCAPLLKQHLLRTLSMTNEELASLEPVIAEAWDRWNQGRQMHYAEAAKNGAPPGMPGPPPGFAVDMAHHEAHGQPPPFGHPNGPGPSDLNAMDFRNRFTHHLNRPVPSFRPPSYGDAHPTASTTTPSSTSGSVPSDPIDPHLTSTNGNGNPPSKSRDSPWTPLISALELTTLVDEGRG